jgi:cytochrome c
MKHPAALLVAPMMALAMCGNAFAEGDAANGKAIFERTCANCHAAQIGVNKIGPSLWDIVGRPIASVPNYNYSPKLVTMRGEWKEWSVEKLDLYLSNPREVLHGVKMFFKGLPNVQDRADIIAYLETFK